MHASLSPHRNRMWPASVCREHCQTHTKHIALGIDAKSPLIWQGKWRFSQARVLQASRPATRSQVRRGGRRRSCILAAAADFRAQYSSLPHVLPRPEAPPAKLPTPPTSASLFDVVPYLMKLALSDRQLWWRLGFSLTFMVVSKSAGLLAPLFMKRSVDALSGTITRTAVNASVMALLMSGACRVVNSVAREVQGPVFTPVAQAAGRRVAYHTFWHVLDLDLTFHLERRTGALSRILERGTRSVSMVFRAVVFTFIPTAVELVLVCMLLGRIFTPAVALLVVSTFVAYVLWTAVLTQAAAQSRKEVNELDNLTTGKAVDSLMNYETVKLFNNEQLEVDAYDSLLVGYQKAAVHTEAIASMLNAGQGVILAVGLTGVMALAASTSAVGSFTAGDLVMAQGLLTQLWGPLQFLGWFYRELRQSLVDMDAFFQILQTRPMLPDGNIKLPDYQPAAASSGGNGASERAVSGAAAGPSGRGLLLELEDVRFGYDKNREVLKGVSLTVERGQSCAIVGSSGSGKSTMLRILMRLYDVQSGAVKLEGLDVRSLQQASLRQAVAVVPQDTVLFNDTVLQNIAYGRPSATREEIIEAAELAQLTKTIERMPDGFDTMVGERGLKLSGGERQRMAIARAFLRQPRLLICDEATSALDSATEREIMSSLERLAKGRTSIFVAHRLSTISRCDKIVVMSGGVIVEQGSHEELMARGMVYSDMYKSQLAATAKHSHEICQQVPMVAAGVVEQPA